MFVSIDIGVRIQTEIENNLKIRYRFQDPRIRHIVDLLQPKPLAENNALIFSLAEIIKDVMLNPEKYSAHSY